jgi:hypothetical chaperone protein
MRLGIDFGTSYSAAGALVGGELKLVRFGDEEQLRTTAYFPHALPDPDAFELTPALERQVEASVRDAKSAYKREYERVERLRAAAANIKDAARRATELALLPSLPVARSDEALHADAIRSVRAQWLADELARGQSRISNTKDALYGEEAVRRFVSEGTGHLIESPKSMLGYRMDERARRIVLNVAASILDHIRVTAGRQFGTVIREAVIGRPVKFKSSLGAQGSINAENLLSEAARIAGFESVRFMEEPAAAAMHFHAQHPDAQRTLVVDIGGGTTDLAYAEIGGAASAPRVLGSWGVAQGGTDVDHWLSIKSFMPLFGKGVLPRVPNHVYSHAAAVHNQQAQRDFLHYDASELPDPYRSRLETLQKPGYTIRLNRAVERTKIALSELASVHQPMDSIEAGLGCTVTQDEAVDAAFHLLRELKSILEEAKREIAERPGSLFLTGGSSRAPYVQDVIREVFPEVPMILGEPSLGVVRGLAAEAAR